MVRAGLLLAVTVKELGIPLFATSQSAPGKGPAENEQSPVSGRTCSGKGPGAGGAGPEADKATVSVARREKTEADGQLGRIGEDRQWGAGFRER